MNVFYEQFSASPLGKQYKAVYDLLKETKLSRNNWSDTEMSNTPFARELDALPDGHPDLLVMRGLQSFGN
jgi:hypothetical protein